ncbi:MAG TPA: S41 family peptidase [Spirochaetota bacterium]|nr:S41 family peptidase [Spirochaetota bacterium]HQF09656.1 S41 family peptidase [Spirochaetota bacterium]HQH98466.1 S41 family peptidase [Spirochaetota bacterium]
MFKKIKERRFHLLVLAFLTGLFIGINVSFLSSATEPAHKYLDYFHRVYQLILTEYVDEASPKDMFYGAIRGMINSLNDPFTRFLDEKSFEELKEMTTGKFQGVGIEITIQDGQVVVVTPIDDSPAMKAGILSGDIITTIDGKAVKGMKLEKIVKLIRGLPKSTVKLQIRREGFDEAMNFELERAPVKITSVEYDIIKEKNIGYLRIKNFGSETTRDVTKALKFFNARGIKKIVIDVRNNPGGLLNSSIEISELLLERGKTIVSTRGKEGSGRVQVFKSQSEPIYRGALVMLVNNGSASASEILAGAIRDNGRGKLLGVKTFGKGSVQKSFNLDDDIGVAITVAKYYTPSGELIHKKGIKPDYEVPLEKLSESEMKNLKIVREKKILEQFVRKETEYTEETKASFRAALSKDGVILPDKTANYILKDWMYRFKKKPLYDMEFDLQLNEAIRHISSGK